MRFDESKVRRERGRFANKDSVRDEAGQVDLGTHDWGHVAPMHNSPWGEVQDTHHIDDGIMVVSTPSHGGIKLSEERNRNIPSYLRRTNGWYEEDCEAYIPAMVYPESFGDDPEQVREQAKLGVREWYPDEYERYTGETIEPGQSRTRDRQNFDRDNANNWVTTSAIRSYIDPSYVEVTAHVGGRYEGEERVYMVPADEYRARGDQRFVVDPERHRQRGFELDGEPIHATDWSAGDSGYATFVESVPVDQEDEYGYPRDDNGIDAEVRTAEFDGRVRLHNDGRGLVAVTRDGRHFRLDDEGEPRSDIEYVSKVDDE